MIEYLKVWLYWRSVRPHPSQYKDQGEFRSHYLMWRHAKPAVHRAR